MCIQPTVSPQQRETHGEVWISEETVSRSGSCAAAGAEKKEQGKKMNRD